MKNAHEPVIYIGDADLLPPYSETCRWSLIKFRFTSTSLCCPLAHPYIVPYIVGFI